jgi:hypothetical protein
MSSLSGAQAAATLQITIRIDQITGAVHRVRAVAGVVHHGIIGRLP